MLVQIQQRRGTAAEWTSINPVLADGEEGLEKDTLKTKWGNGVTAWNSLPYVSGSGLSDSAVAAIITGGTATPAAIDDLIADGTTGKLDDSATSGVLLGRYSVGTGTIEEVGLGDGLTIVAGDLSVDDTVGEAGPPGPPGVAGATVTANLSGGSFPLNPTYGTEYTLTILADTALSVSGMIPGSAMTVTVLQDGIGGHTLTIPSTWIGQADFTPNAIANNYDIFVIWRTPLGVFIKRVHTGVLPSSSWTPNALADQQCWYIGDSLPLEEGDAVGTWANQWATRGPLTAANSPVAKLSHGVRYVSFDGALSQKAELSAGASFGTALTQPYTIAVLAKVNGTGTQRVFNSGTAVANQGPEISSADTPRNWYANTQDLNALTDNGQWTYLVYQVTGTSSTLRRNGVSAAVTTGIGSGITLSGIRLAASSGTVVYSTVDIAEVIIFKHLPGGPELANLETYLSNRADLLNGV